MFFPLMTKYSEPAKTRTNEYRMPIKYTTFTEEEFQFFNDFAEKITKSGEEFEFNEEDFTRIGVGMKTMLENLKEYQNQRLKINKESRESKKAARDAEGGGAKRGASVKMTGAVKLVPIDADAGIFTVQKVKIPAPTAIHAFAPSEIDEEKEENIAENPEAIAAAVAEATVRKEEQQKKINNARAKAQPKPKQEKKTTITVPKKKSGKAAVVEQLCALAPPAVPKHLQEQYDDDATESESEE